MVSTSQVAKKEKNTTAKEQQKLKAKEVALQPTADSDDDSDIVPAPKKKVAVLVNTADDSDGDSDVLPTPKAKASVVNAAADSDDDSDEPPPKAKAKAVVKKPPAKQDEDSDDDSDVVPAPKTKAVVTKATVAPADDSDDDSDAPAPKAKVESVVKAVPANKSDDSDDDSDMEPAPKAKVKAKAAADAADDSDDDSDDVPPRAPKAKAAKASPKVETKKAPATGGDDSDDDSDDEVAPEAKRPVVKMEEDSVKETVAEKEKVDKKDVPSADVLNLRVFVRNIPLRVNEETLRNDFEKCGKIVSIEMPKAPGGKRKGIAFITFKSPKGVNAALNLSRSPDLYDGQAKIMIANSKQKPKDDDKKPHKKDKDRQGKALREGLIKEMLKASNKGNYAQLVQLAETVASMARSAKKAQPKESSAKVASPNDSSANSGDRTSKRKAMPTASASPPKQASNATVSPVKQPAIDANISKERCVTITNLAFNLTEDALRDHFAKCGPIEKLHMPTKKKNGTNSNRGFAKITFGKQSSVNKAAALNGTELNGRSLKIDTIEDSKEISTPEPKSESKLKRSLPDKEEGSVGPKNGKKAKTATADTPTKQ